MLGDISFTDALAGQADALEAAIAAIGEEVRTQQAAGAFTGPGPIFVGIGASYAAAAAPVWTLRARGIHSWRLSAGDHPLPFPASDHPIVGISQSGKSTETLAVLESVAPGLRYAVVNNTSSPIADLATYLISLGNLPDSYASTIGFTATIAALGMVADVWGGGAIHPEWIGVPAAFRSVQRQVDEQLGTLVDVFEGAAAVDFVGAGASAGTAEGAALLFREVARLPAMGTSTRQYLHGQMESAGDGVHVLFGDDREVEIAHTLSAAGHRVLVVSPLDVPAGDGVRSVRLPVAEPAPRAILEVLVAQMLVEAVADRRGLDIEEFVFFNADTKVEGAAPS